MSIRINIHDKNIKSVTNANNVKHIVMIVLIVTIATIDSSLVFGIDNMGAEINIVTKGNMGK